MNLQMRYLNPDMSLLMTIEKGNESRNEIQTKKLTWLWHLKKEMNRELISLNSDMNIGMIFEKGNES